MQYIQPNQATNGIQYLQLLPTRPLIVPISPYLSQLPQYGGTQGTLPNQSINGQNYASGQNYVTAGQNYVATNYGQYGATPNYPTYKSFAPGGYATASSSPVVSFFRPHSGIQLINGPIDMSLNTNEYIPIQGESAFKMRRA